MEKYDVEVDEYSTIRFYKPGTSIIHRLDGPAVESVSGTKAWFVNGEQHRLDGPAVVARSGTKHWYVDGKRHRLDGPAIEHANGTKFWLVEGKQHRLDGPAIEWADGDKSWYIDGNELTETQFKKKTAPVAKELTIGDIEKLLGHKVKVVK